MLKLVHLKALLEQNRFCPISNMKYVCVCVCVCVCVYYVLVTDVRTKYLRFLN